MHTTINSMGDTAIVEEERDGDRWLIARNVRIIKPKRLTNGYVPEESIERSLNQDNTHGGTGWEGVPTTLAHPRNLSAHSWYDPSRPDGEPVLAATANVTDELGLGRVENQRSEDGAVVADVAVNADRASEVGGEAEDVIAALEDDDPLDVSTQYVGAELPAGEYDGEHRDVAEAIVAPDSLALLPNAPGQCSTLEGCGVNPVSSPLGVAANAAESELRLETGHQPDEPSQSGAGRGAAAEIRTIASNAIDSIRSLGGSASPGASAGNGVSGTGAVDLDAAAETAVSAGANTDGSDCDCGSGNGCDCDDDNHTTDNDNDNDDNESMNDQELAAALGVSLEHVKGLSDEERATLEAAAEDGAQTETDTDDEETEAGGTNETDDEDAATTEKTETETETDDDTDDADTIVVDRAELDERIDERVEERVAANEERREREQRVDTIVANSAEYDDEDRDELMDTPDSVLDRIEQGVSSGTELPARGPSANTTAGGAGGDDLGGIEVGTGQIDEIEAGSQGGD
jgi:hypothetical protein